MKFALVFLASLFLSMAGAQAVDAQTRTLRHPATGSPAIMVDMPNDWTDSIDTSGNLIIASANRQVAFSITVATESKSAEAVAREALELAGGQGVASQGAGAIAPYAGSFFTGTLPMSGQQLKLRCVVVKPDTDHFVAVTLVTNPAATAIAQGEAALVFSNMKIVQ